MAMRFVVLYIEDIEFIDNNTILKHNNTNLTAALDELAEAVRTSGRSYDATEQENARALGAVDPGAGSLLRGSF